MLSSLKLENSTIRTRIGGRRAFTPPQVADAAAAQFADLHRVLPRGCGRSAVTSLRHQDEVWAPASGERQVQATATGWNGNIDMTRSPPARRGYATASTDTGHQGGGGPGCRTATS